MYGIFFKFQSFRDPLGRICSTVNSCSPVYLYISKELEHHNFKPLQDNNIFISDTADAVTTITTFQNLINKYPFILSSIEDVQMLRIEETTSLMSAANLITN